MGHRSKYRCGFTLRGQHSNKARVKKQILVFLLLNRTLQESSHHSLASAALSMISQIIVSGVLTPDAASHKGIKQFIQFITCGRISHIWMVHAQGKKKKVQLEAMIVGKTCMMILCRMGTCFFMLLKVTKNCLRGRRIGRSAH